MPGYKEEQERLDAVRKEAEDARKKQKLQNATKELMGRKYWEVMKATGVKNKAFHGFVSGFAAANAVALLIGSFAWLMAWEHDKDAVADYNANPNYYSADEIPSEADGPTYGIYGDMSYGQAIKNAYLWDDFRKGNGGLFQGICGLLSVVIALGAGASLALKNVKDKDYLKKVKDIYDQLELLKDYGIDAKKLVQGLEPEAKQIISKMSELDRGYFDNLLAGGMTKANYDTCVAIVSGYLKSHPKEYNNVIAIIDENTLPESIKKKYGKEKTISFGAAQAMMHEDR